MHLRDRIRRLLGNSTTAADKRESEPVNTTDDEPAIATEAAVKGVDPGAISSASGASLGGVAGTVQHRPVHQLADIGPAGADRLRRAGILTVDDLAHANAGDIAEETNMSRSRLERWIDAADAATTSERRH